MFAITLTLLLAFALVSVIQRLPEATRDSRLYGVVALGFASRLVASAFIDRLNIFSYGSGVDAEFYRDEAALIAKIWEYTGVHYMTGQDLHELSETSLPQNIYALIAYVNGEQTRLGCAALVAAMACVTCLNMYSIAMELGARRDIAITMAWVTMFTPSFFFHTADAFKDGFVVFFEFGILGSAIRMSRRFSFAALVIALGCFAGLWVTRFYLVYAMVGPLLLGALGMRARSMTRSTFTVVVIAIMLAVIVGYTQGVDSASEHVAQTLARGTSEDAIAGNASGGSGVTLAVNSAAASFGVKLVYSLFSPFPWQAGSIALQLAKLESFAWYYFTYRAIRAGLEMWRTHRSDLLIFLSFIGPVTFIYTVSFANIGLVFRERMGVVLAMELLATLSWGRAAVSASEEEDEGAVAPA